MEKKESFDRKLAVECARSFSTSTGLGCLLCGQSGEVYASFGLSCASCALCRALGAPPERCARAQAGAAAEAERFGGKYIYFCPGGLSCFVSPIVGELGTEARLTAGPFLMVDRQEFLELDLRETAQLSGEALEEAAAASQDVPFVPPGRVDQLATLLFMAAGFLNNAAAETRLLENARSGEIQGQMTAYLQTLKQEGRTPDYPFELERRFLQSVSRRDRQEADRLLNELLGAILFADGGDLETMKTRVWELLVLLSRAAVRGGADSRRALRQNREAMRRLPGFTTVDSLCLWLSGALSATMDELFAFAGAKHADVLRRCLQYLGEHYSEPVTLRQAADHVHLTPQYLCRVFRSETGETFSEALNRVRIGKARELLASPGLRLTDISLLAGYADQSYFTKMFKRVTGELPRDYRARLLRGEEPE